MTVTPTTLARAAGVSAVTAGLLFLGVQIRHPVMTAQFATTTEYAVRESVKVVMAVLALVGISGVYLRHVSRAGLLGLVGYVLFGIGYLALMSVEVVGVAVLPTLARRGPGYVGDVLSVANGGPAVGDIGAMGTLLLVSGLTYLAGGLLFGVALFRAGILARCASALLAIGSLATGAIPLLPQVNQRLFAIPTGVALVGLGVSLWREQRSLGSRSLPVPVAPPLAPAGVR